MKITGYNLKSCPFCGGGADIYAYDRKGIGTDYTYGVRCRECGVQTTTMFRSAEIAAEKWNTRTYDGEKYILIAVSGPDSEISESFYNGKEDAVSGMTEDMLSCTEYRSLEEIIDAADAGLCGFDSDGESWAITEDGYIKYWKIIRTQS